MISAFASFRSDQSIAIREIAFASRRRTVGGGPAALRAVRAGARE
jgi:hypothetical protein